MTKPSVVVVTERRRRFSKQEKIDIVSESEAASTSSEIARKYDISLSLLYQWRKRFREKSSSDQLSSSIFVPVNTMSSPIGSIIIRWRDFAVEIPCNLGPQQIAILIKELDTRAKY
jgi:hypothetical protein